MFLSFFYLLRARGLNPSAGEWMTLMQALDKGLAAPDLLSFYYLCRSILVTSEADFDKFDLAFLEFFEGVAAGEDLNGQFMKWLTEDRLMLSEERRLFEESIERSLEELWRMFEERKREQTERHDGGSYWIGTGGTSPFGNSGYAKSGILAGGPGGRGRALQVAGERNFRDFRKDRIIDLRQFQTAFRKLRQYSSRVDTAKTEL
ncbi:MAG: VWA containing CoxE family protein, partial [Clostridiales Family XIII bacterium]|nr:VWA containing CoxE family protein [Clostridiales Family XIII bacterium]